MLGNSLKAAGVPEEEKLFVNSKYVKDKELCPLMKYQTDTEEKDRSLTAFLDILSKQESVIARKNDIKTKLLPKH